MPIDYSCAVNYGKGRRCKPRDRSVRRDRAERRDIVRVAQKTARTSLAAAYLAARLERVRRDPRMAGVEKSCRMDELLGLVR